MEAANKGSHCKGMVSHIKRAKSELHVEANSSAAGSLQAKTQNKFKMTVLERANELSRAFLSALQNGKVFEAFPTAGNRFRMTSMECDDMEETYDTYKNNPINENWD
eukprot:12652391-Prorocentrum_lima.AAC.1